MVAVGLATVERIEGMLAMTTDDTTIPVPRHLVETLRDANLPANHPILNGTIAAIVALLPPPKRWTDEDMEMVMGALDSPFAHPKFGYTVEDLRRQTEAILTALDEAGRLAPLEEQ